MGIPGGGIPGGGIGIPCGPPPTPPANMAFIFASSDFRSAMVEAMVCCRKVYWVQVYSSKP